MGLFKKKKEEDIKEQEEDEEEEERAPSNNTLITLKPVIPFERELARLTNIMLNNADNSTYKEYLSKQIFAGDKEKEAAFMQGYNFALLMLSNSPNKMYSARMIYGDFKAWCKENNVDYK